MDGTITLLSIGSISGVVFGIVFLRLFSFVPARVLLALSRYARFEREFASRHLEMSTRNRRDLSESTVRSPQKSAAPKLGKALSTSK